MFTNAFILALAASPLVAAHGKVAVVTGDAGGNGTALGILGAVVPGPGPNKKTEVDTTVFGSTKIQTDGLGKTNGNGKNTVKMLSLAMDQSGSTLPQVSNTLSGTFHIVTSDGAGPLQAVLDPTGTGAFASGKMLQVQTQVPGKNGNIRKTKGARGLLERALDSVGLGIFKRATNINEDFPMAFSVPSDTQCSGTINGVQNVCLVKIANNNRAGPFGGVVAIQMANQGAGAATPAAAPAARRRSAKFVA